MLASSYECIHFFEKSETKAWSRYLDAEFVGEIDGSQTKDLNEFFRGIQSALRFPEYFGNNWDAAEECLRDLHWISASSYSLFIYEAQFFFEQVPKIAGMLIQIWLSVAAEWAEVDVGFHLVFIW